MFKKYILRFFFLGAILFTTSCEDGYLEKYPLDGPSADYYFNNEAELILAVNGCYKGLNFQPSDGIPWPLILDHVTDISWDRNNSAWQDITKGSHDSNNGFVRSVWSNFYRTIGRCNFILDNMGKLNGKMSEPLYLRSQAEVRFIRAFSYHILIELFGGVPLVSKTITLSEAQMPKSTKEEVLDFVSTELEEASANLPWTYTGNDAGRITKGAALGIKARAALFNQKWSVAATAAKQVIDSKSYSLHNNYENLFRYAGEKSPENMLNLQFLRGVGTHNTFFNLLSRLGQGTSNKVPGQCLVDAFECSDGLTIDKSPLYNPKTPYRNRDPRLGYTLVVPGSVFFNYQFETHKDSLTVWNYNNTPATRVANTDATNAFATFTGYCWRKYVDIADKGLGNSELSVTMLRYAEVLLTYAEAKIEANELDQSVYDAINLVRQRATVAMPAITAGKTQAQLRSAIRKERKYELSMEGFRLFDIRRWKIAEQVMPGNFLGRIPKGLLANAPVIDDNGTPNYSNVSNRAEMRIVETRLFNKDRDYLWPIPFQETVTNKKLEQNPNY